MNACSVCKSCDAKLSGVSSRLASGISTEALLSSCHPLNAEKVSTPVCCMYVRLADIYSNPKTSTGRAMYPTRVRTEPDGMDQTAKSVIGR